MPHITCRKSVTTKRLVAANLRNYGSKVGVGNIWSFYFVYVIKVGKHTLLVSPLVPKLYAGACAIFSFWRMGT